MEEFERVRPWLEAALEYSGGTHSIEDVRAAILEDKLALITRPNAVAVVEIVVYPRKKALRVFAAGGELSGLIDIAKTFPALAKAAGCNRYEEIGRPGWARALGFMGMTKMTFMFKDV